jgi:hypothetical protein
MGAGEGCGRGVDGGGTGVPTRRWVRGGGHGWRRDGMRAAAHGRRARQEQGAVARCVRVCGVRGAGRHGQTRGEDVGKWARRCQRGRRQRGRWGKGSVVKRKEGAAAAWQRDGTRAWRRSTEGSRHGVGWEGTGSAQREGTAAAWGQDRTHARSRGRGQAGRDGRGGADAGGRRGRQCGHSCWGGSGVAMAGKARRRGQDGPQSSRHGGGRRERRRGRRQRAADGVREVSAEGRQQ